MGRRAWLTVEFVVLFAGVPALLTAGVLPLYVIPSLVGGAVVCLVVLLRDPAFERAQLWSVRRAVKGARAVAAAFAAGACGLAGLALWLEPERFLWLPRERPGLWAAIMALYPALSVYPQEVIYRAFVFHRYRGIFTGRRAMIGASAGAFALAHTPFGHGLSVGLSAVGGVLFAWTYARTRTVVAPGVEHALYGCFVFTVGLGSYFYAARP